MFKLIPLIILLFGTAPSNSVRNISVSKCCNLNETLSSDNKCVLLNSAPMWNLKIYLPSLKRFQKNKLLSHWTIRESNRPQCAKPVLVSQSASNYFPFPNGSAFVVEYGGVVVHPEQYCIDYNAAVFCLNEPEQIVSIARVKKCCLENAIFSQVNKSCIHMKNDAYKIEVDGSKGLRLGYGFPNCENRIVAGRFNEGTLQENGSLLMGGGVLLAAGNFCLEHIFEHAGQSPSIFACPNDIASQLTIVPAEAPDLRFTIYPIGLGLSAVFLAATLLAGSLLPASHHVLHWRCQTNHVACLLFGDILLCIVQLTGKMNPGLCITFAVLQHFLFLAAFFWLNTMCFNIWWTFHDLRPQSTEMRQERLRLRFYEAYAWGLPLLISSTALILDTIPQGTDYTFLRPNFGINSCWFYGNWEIFTFFYGPIGALLFINLALFLLTARELTCGLWKRELVKSTTERAALGRVCMKLVVVMGVTWVVDIISWLVGGPQEIWYVTDVINSLQGVLIFIVVGCQPQVLSAVKRYWCTKKHRQSGTAGTTNHHSSSSQGIPSMGDTLTNTNSVTHNTTKSVPLETSC